MSTQDPIPRTPETRPKGPNSTPSGKPGTNAVEHEPDPKAKPMEGDGKHKPSSPYTPGNV